MINGMKIYFAGSIAGGRDDAALYEQIIIMLKPYGEVLTEHVGNSFLATSGEYEKQPKEVHDRDIEWLLRANIVVAEVTTPSLGVGYEIGRAIEHKIRVICLYRQLPGKRLSPMIAGSSIEHLIRYQTLRDLERPFKKLLQQD